MTDERGNSAGSIILAFFAIVTSVFLLMLSERKRAAVGRREMQLFLIGYIITSICEIFTVGAFPLDPVVRKVRPDGLFSKTLS